MTQPIVTAPPFGQDTSATDYVKTGVIVSGNRLVAEALYRRLTSERGSLEYDQNYGFNITKYLQSAGTDAGSLLALRSEIISECRKEERVDDVDCVITPTRISGPEVDAVIDITVTLSNSDTFLMTFPVSSVATPNDINLLTVSEAA